MPSVLVELGFLTNPTEEDYLISNQGQDYMASALFRAFRDYAEHWFSLESAVQKPPVDKGPQEGSNGEAPAPDAPSDSTPDATGIDHAEQATPPSWFDALTHQCNTGICFTVQAASSRSGAPLQSEGFDIPHVTQERSRGVYKYRVGSSPSYEDACHMRDTLRVKGFPDAFVVAFEDGSRIPLEDAIRRQRK
jgi:N-acetylmuramoyl-L-alanine amidase